MVPVSGLASSFEVGPTARDLARELWQMYVAAGYPNELGAFSVLDDWYDMIETGVAGNSIDEVDREVEVAARALTGGDASQGVARAAWCRR
jgi:hypothetical protein